MLRRGKGRWGRENQPNDDPSLQEQEDPRADANDWEPEERSADFPGAASQGLAMGAAPGEAPPAFSGIGYAAAAPDAVPEAALADDAYAGDYPADEDDAYAAGDEGFAAEDEQGWYEDGQEEDAGERALALYDTPQPPARRGIVGAMLLRISGEGRELATLEPRATGPVLVPGSGKVARPGAFGHTLFSPRAHRPRPFLMIVFIIMLALMTVTATAMAAAPIDTQYQVYTSFNAFAGLTASSPTSQPRQYNWYVVHYGDTLTSIANKFQVSPNGILLMNGLQDADQLYVGLSLKIPTDPNYGKNAQVGVVNIPPPPPDKSGNVFGTNPWNSLSGPTDPNNICAPPGNSDTVADRQAFQLIEPNPNASFARGFTWYHNGVDLDNPNGTPILAAQAGLVVFAGWDTLGLGWSVKINHCNGLSTMYGHMLHPPLVKAGDYVTVGQQIGQEGSTGNSTGPHLHFMTEWWNKPANPYCFDFHLPAGNTPCTA
jgi:LysM repeat protein